MIKKLKYIELEIESKNIIASTDVNKEALSNTRYIGFTVEEFLNIGKKELLHSLERMKIIEIAKWKSRGCIFYCWFDDMAGQIRFSSIASKWQKLPFRCNVTLVNDIKDIVDIAFLYTDKDYTNPDIEALHIYVNNKKILN